MDFDSRHHRTASWIGVLLLAIATAVLIFRGNWSGSALLGAFLTASIAFLLLEDRLPSLFDTLFVSAAIVNAAGWVWDLYERMWGYDEFAHFYTTFAVTLTLGYLVFYAMREHFRRHPVHFLIVLTSFGVTLGAWWEVLEWVVLKKLNDPVGDIVVDSLGAMLAAALALWTLARRGPAKADAKGERARHAGLSGGLDSVS